jgi:hypothetical protein
MTVRALPTVDGYTMDERLREFRKFPMNCASEESPLPEFIPFDSPKGKKLLEKHKCCEDFCNHLDALILDEKQATKEYMDISNKAKQNNEPFISIIMETLSKDEAKHGKALSDIQMLVCKK